jgi:hypothetical protein
MLKSIDPEIDMIIKQQEEVVRNQIAANLKLIESRLRKKI